MENESGNQPQRILVFRIGHLGDTIVALPAFWALRNAFSNSSITLLSNSDTKNPSYVSARNVLPERGMFDERLSYPNQPSAISGLVSQVKLLLEIRKRKYDALFYLMTRNRTEVQIKRDLRFFRLAGIRRFFCIDHTRKNLLESPIPKPVPEIKSEAEFLADCLRSEGIEINEGRTDLALSPDERSFAEEWTNRLDISTDDRTLVAVAPGSKWTSKIWPVERFEEVVSRLIRDFAVFPIVIGGKEDHEIGERLLGSWGIGANAAGELSIRESAALLEHCFLYLGNDSGVMHLAASVGTPCVAVFSAVDWIGRWKPFGKNNHLFRERVECEGCHSPTCFNNGKCLDLISVDQVYEACRESIITKRATAAVIY
jgi:heptosyltransferase-3